MSVGYGGGREPREKHLRKTSGQVPGMHVLSSLPHIHLSQIPGTGEYSHHITDEETETRVSDSPMVTQVVKY